MELIERKFLRGNPNVLPKSTVGHIPQMAEPKRASPVKEREMIKEAVLRGIRGQGLTVTISISFIGLPL